MAAGAFGMLEGVKRAFGRLFRHGDHAAGGAFGAADAFQDRAGAGVRAGMQDGKGAKVDLRGAKRIDIISDTHGHVSERLRAELAGADLIVHAGDITSESDFAEFETIAPVRAVLGNNDWYYDYGPEVKQRLVFAYEGLTFGVSHYREDLPQGSIDVAVCGHTHRPQIVPMGRMTLVNPGSPTYPRTAKGPTMARLYARDGEILSLEIIQLQ